MDVKWNYGSVRHASHALECVEILMRIMFIN